MKTEISATLRRILNDTQAELEHDKSRKSVKRLKHMIRDAVPLISFSSALSPGQALIAEIKERSPSQGKMRPQNVQEAPEAYKKSRAVKAISVLTSWKNFGQNMRIEMMEAIKRQTSKPVLRKDFILEEYQIYQARAYPSKWHSRQSWMCRRSRATSSLPSILLRRPHAPLHMD